MFTRAILDRCAVNVMRPKELYKEMKFWTYNTDLMTTKEPQPWIDKYIYK